MHTDLWNHALALYGRPGVETACLALQDLGGDVCLLLCATWLQARRVAVDEARIKALRGLAEPWQGQVVGPLRELRQRWRNQAHDDSALATLRMQVKAMELEAEKVLLTRLQACSQLWPADPGGASGDWLDALAPANAQGHGALLRLRAAARGLQEAEDGV